jgi:hypothetical protein
MTAPNVQRIVLKAGDLEEVVQQFAAQLNMTAEEVLDRAALSYYLRLRWLEVGGEIFLKARDGTIHALQFDGIGPLLVEVED